MSRARFSARRPKTLSTRALGAAVVSTAAVGGLAVAATPGDANSWHPYWNYRCTNPKSDHSGPQWFNSLSNYGSAASGCNGGTGHGWPCITMKSQHGRILAHKGWYYCSGGAGNGWVASNCINVCYGSEGAYMKGVVRLSGGHGTYRPHWLDGSEWGQ
jgi:hypothetical protein